MRVLSEVEVSVSAAAALRALPGVEFEVLPFHEQPWDVPRRMIPGLRVLLCKTPPRNLDSLADLELLQISTVGYEHLRHLNLGERAFRVCNARGVFDSAIAEWNLAMMVNLARDLRAMIRNQEASRWEKAARFQQELRGKTLGLWGYGGIGRETARLAHAFGMRIDVMTRQGVGPRDSAFTPAGTGDPAGRLPRRVFVAGQEADFLDGLDFLVLALPHTKASDGMVGERELRALGPKGFLLNPARGPIVQEAALLGALREGWIAGAALDTHFAYPLPMEHPLWHMPNVILTPHISGADKSQAFPERMGELLAENVRRLRDGLELLNLVTRGEWEECGADDQ